ncbi:hypothetical protein EMCG_03110 [[Emmonsia] crescens]|uniref:Uncharacterized protein n=1 Tax=[Emmonsia] crescens TaxID=73230 RepID=A0A0G2HW76_9EURO|nr:hypothetical protein EMCG_03110 [Emmonsia crescens UAMH 3008]
MDALRTLTARGDNNKDSDNNNNGGLNPTTINLLISLLVLILLFLALIGSYLVIRRKRQARQLHQQQQKESELPMYENQNQNNRRQRGGAGRSRRLTISASNRDSIYVIGDEKGCHSHSSLSPPHSPVPEIRITFPEEEDAAGRRMSGRVVVVRISEKGGIGLEPFYEEREGEGEDLPPYQSQSSGNNNNNNNGGGSSAERFQSLDLERMGGLKEKEMEMGMGEKRWS